MPAPGFRIQQGLPLHNLVADAPIIQHSSHLQFRNNTVLNRFPGTGTLFRLFTTSGLVPQNNFLCERRIERVNTGIGQFRFKAVFGSGGLPPSESEVARFLNHKGRHGRPDDAERDTATKSIEDTLGLLKEQVEEDKRKRQQGTSGEIHPDIRKVLKRSKVLAKQLISQSSAGVIGFVSQLWVSAGHLKVVALEVRPSLLSGEAYGVLLDDVCQVGDVVLVSDESVLENEMTFRESETLVGYDLLTENGKYLGKVRDFSFNLHEGKVTSLEFDSLGFSVIPSSVISTYWLDAEEIVEILSDSIVICQGAESRVRRLSKGIWQLPIERKKARNMKSTRKGSRRELPSRNPSFHESADFEITDKNTDLAEYQQF